MNWQQARALAEEHQAQFRDELPRPAPVPRAPRPRRGRRRVGWMLVDVGLRLAVGGPPRSARA